MKCCEADQLLFWLLTKNATQTETNHVIILLKFDWAL